MWYFLFVADNTLIFYCGNTVLEDHTRCHEQTEPQSRVTAVLMYRVNKNKT